MADIPSSETLFELFTNGRLAEEIERHFGLIERADVETIQARCVALHNAGSIDLFSLVEDGALEAIEGSAFFQATDFFCGILPELETSPARMMACVKTMVDRGGEDLAANRPNAALRAWCSKDPSRGHEIIAAAHEDDELAICHLTFALAATENISEAREIALSYDDERRLGAITALGRITDADSKSRAGTLATLDSLANQNPVDTERAILLTTAVAVLTQGSDESVPEGATLVQKLVKGAGEATLHWAAQALWDSKFLQPEIINALLEALTHINPANKATLRALDQGLCTLLKHDHADAAIEYVTQIFSGPDDGLKLHDFSGFADALLTGPPERLSRVVVQWLQYGAPRLCHGLAEAVRGDDIAGPVLNLRAGDLALSPDAQIFICRKAIGWFFFKPKTAASILVSVLRSCDADTAKEVGELLADPLLLNYGGIRDYLGSLEKDDPAKTHVDRGLAANEAYLAAMRQIPTIKELKPSEQQRRIEHLRRSDEMREVFKQVQSQSVLLNLVSRSTVLYGQRTVSYIKDNEGRLRSMAMDLQPHRTEFEMPRIQIVDPVGLELVLQTFRFEAIVS